MPHQLEAFKIAEQANLSHRRMFVTLLFATGFGVLVAFWVQLHMYHKHGADSGYFGPWALGHGRRLIRGNTVHGAIGFDEVNRFGLSRLGGKHTTEITAVHLLPRQIEELFALPTITHPERWL